jgi:hypothetical protein
MNEWMDGWMDGTITYREIGWRKKKPAVLEGKTHTLENSPGMEPHFSFFILNYRRFL